MGESSTVGADLYVRLPVLICGPGAVFLTLGFGGGGGGGRGAVCDQECPLQAPGALLAQTIPLNWGEGAWCVLYKVVSCVMRWTGAIQ